MKSHIKQVWITGRIEGLQNQDILEKFNSIQEHLEGAGYKVSHILYMFVNSGADFQECCKKDMISMFSCDIVCAASDWMTSHKAISEISAAQDVNMRIIDAETLMPIKARVEKMPLNLDKAWGVNEMKTIKSDFNNE